MMARPTAMQALGVAAVMVVVAVKVEVVVVVMVVTVVVARPEVLALVLGARRMME